MKRYLIKVSISGYLDSSTLWQLQEHLEGLLERKAFRVILDIEELAYMSSAGVGIIMGILPDFRKENGDIIIIKMPPKIRNLFDMLGFSRLIKIRDDVGQAVAEFKKIEQPSEQKEADAY